MGEYELIVFMSDNIIRVLEVDYEGGSKVVGFHGEDQFAFKDAEGIDDFFNILLDTYNVNSLDELDASVYLVDCGIEGKLKWMIVDKVKACQKVCLFNIENVLPIWLSLNGLLEVGKQVVVEFLDEKYAYICDDEYRVELLPSRVKKSQHTVTIQDFDFLAIWKGALSSGSNSESEEQAEEYTAAMTEWQEKEEEYKDQIQKLNNNYEVLKKELESKQKQLHDVMNKQAEKVDNEVEDNRRLVMFETNYDNEFIQLEKTDGEIVKANQQIGFTISSRDNGYLCNKIFAPRSGKLAWLPLDGDEYKKRSSNRYTHIVGVVGDEKDDVNSMKKWLKQKLEKKTVKTN